jgi:glutamine amidotransferase
MIVIINYGLGNLHSVHKAVVNVGGAALVTDNPREIMAADKVILPGVGAFADGMKGLESRGLVPVIQNIAAQGRPLLGICLGMQLLFEGSEEQGYYEGLGLLAGKVVLFQHPGVKVPQIGWNQVQVSKPSDLMSGINEGDFFYFNHGYYCIPEDPNDVLTMTDYGVLFASSVERDAIFGVQFHPEKSQQRGLKILKNFVEM